MRKLPIIALILLALAPRVQALNTEDLLALVAMPLAVAAVADLTGVPESELASLAATLNNAAVPPVQFVEVIRYVPVALVTEVRPEFVQFVRTQADQGVRGPALVTVIEQRLRTIEPEVVIQPRPATRVIVVDDAFIPTFVRTRAARRRDHPHGGPPGQLKKERGTRPMISSSDDYDDDRDRGRDRGRGKQKEKDRNKGRGKGKD